MLRELRVALLMFLALSFVTGVAYPVLVTVVAQVVFPDRAKGSLVHSGGRQIGSELIGQTFTSPGYFWSRPSATSRVPYDGAASSGSNQAVGNPALLDAVRGRIERLRVADPGNRANVPIDLVTASGSGLDPHISIAAADYQAGRVARTRSMPLDDVQRLIREATEPRTFGVLGEPRVNVLKLNLALDASRPGR